MADGESAFELSTEREGALSACGTDRWTGSIM
jgi:hypothetical protein